MWTDSRIILCIQNRIHKKHFIIPFDRLWMKTNSGNIKSLLSLEQLMLPVILCIKSTPIGPNIFSRCIEYTCHTLAKAVQLRFVDLSHQIIAVVILYCRMSYLHDKNACLILFFILCIVYNQCCVGFYICGGKWYWYHLVLFTHMPSFICYFKYSITLGSRYPLHVCKWIQIRFALLNHYTHRIARIFIHLSANNIFEQPHNSYDSLVQINNHCRFYLSLNIECM